MLQSQYRIPIEIVTKITGTRIQADFIRRTMRDKTTHPKDKVFLVYDADRPDVLERLRSIKNVELILSNPAIELWFLLHYKNQAAVLDEAACCQELSKRNRTKYVKGKLDHKLRQKLLDFREKACRRAEKLAHFENPSSTMYQFIAELEREKSR